MNILFILLGYGVSAFLHGDIDPEYFDKLAEIGAEFFEIYHSGEEDKMKYFKQLEQQVQNMEDIEDKELVLNNFRLALFESERN